MLEFIAGFALAIFLVRWVNSRPAEKKAAPAELPKESPFDALRKIVQVQKIDHAHKIARRTLDVWEGEGISS